jgi:hypothetical protein
MPTHETKNKDHKNTKPAINTPTNHDQGQTNHNNEKATTRRRKKAV